MPKLKRITPKDTQAKEAFAYALIKWLKKRDLFEDVFLYVNGFRYSDSPSNNGQKIQIGDGIECYRSVCEDPCEIVEYANPELITMTFEGALYHALNYGDGRTEKALNDLFEARGLYFEYGYAWSLSAYEN